jgi:hypothetical protein
VRSLSFLTPANHVIARQVLSDLDRCIAGEWVLAGSLSYRPWLPPHERAGHLHDVDVVLDPFGARVPARGMVLPTVHERFRVTHRSAMYSGVYFGMVHRATRLWVDMYTSPHRLRSEQFTLGGLEIAGQVPEETFFALIKELLVRSSRRRPVKPTWVANAKVLWRNVDHDQVFELMRLYRAEYRSFLPHQTARGPLRDVVAYALSVPASAPRPDGRR